MDNGVAQSNDRLERILSMRLARSPYLARAPMLLAMSPFVAALSLFFEGNASYILAITALSIGVLGAILEYVFLLVVSVIRDSRKRGSPGLLSLFWPALSIGLYATGVGIILARNISRSALEYCYEEYAANAGCRSPSSALLLVTLGAALAGFQECVTSRLAASPCAVSYERPVDLGAVGYEGEEEPGDPDARVEDDSPG